MLVGVTDGIRVDTPRSGPLDRWRPGRRQWAGFSGAFPIAGLAEETSRRAVLEEQVQLVGRGGAELWRAMSDREPSGTADASGIDTSDADPAAAPAESDPTG